MIAIVGLLIVVGVIIWLVMGSDRGDDKDCTKPAMPPPASAIVAASPRPKPPGGSASASPPKQAAAPSTQSKSDDDFYSPLNPMNPLSPLCPFGVFSHSDPSPSPSFDPSSFADTPSDVGGGGDW